MRTDANSKSFPKLRTRETIWIWILRFAMKFLLTKNRIYGGSNGRFLRRQKYVVVKANSNNVFSYQIFVTSDLFLACIFRFRIHTAHTLSRFGGAVKRTLTQKTNGEINGFHTKHKTSELHFILPLRRRGELSDNSWLPKM